MLEKKRKSCAIGYTSCRIRRNIPYTSYSTIFQNVYPLLPFTYAISAMREAVGGIYMPNLTKDISTLAIFIVVFATI